MWFQLRFICVFSGSVGIRLTAKFSRNLLRSYFPASATGTQPMTVCCLHGNKEIKSGDQVYHIIHDSKFSASFN